MSTHNHARPPVPGPACKSFAPLLPLVAQNGLEADEANRLRQHLATCNFCQSELASYNQMDALLARRFGPAARGPLSPEDIRELSSSAYRPRTTLAEPMPAPVENKALWQRPETPRRLKPPSRPAAPRRSRRFFSTLSAIAAVLVIAAVSVALFKSHTPTRTGSATPQTSPGATATPSGIFPTFSDWRVAYIGSDGSLHVVSQNGATDSRANPVLPLLEPGSGYHIFTAGISPDGHFFAYGNDQTYIVNLATHNASALAVTTIPIVPDSLIWSPDSKWLAIDNAGQWEVVDMSKSQLTPTLVKTPSNVQILGWADATHLLGLSGNLDANAVNVTLSLLSVNIFTGTQQTIATVFTGDMGWINFDASPDGKQVLVYTSPPGEGATSDTFTPFVEVIDTATGQKHTLPNIAQLTGAAFDFVAWKSGTQMAGFSTTDGAWTANLADDSATKLPNGQYPVGWAPDTGALILSSSVDNAPASEAMPHQLSILPASSPTTATPLVLVQAAYSLPFVGFVRTA